MYAYYYINVYYDLVHGKRWKLGMGRGFDGGHPLASVNQNEDLRYSSGGDPKSRTLARNHEFLNSAVTGTGSLLAVPLPAG